MFFQAQPWAPRFTKHGSGGFSDAVTGWRFEMEISTMNCDSCSATVSGLGIPKEAGYQATLSDSCDITACAQVIYWMIP